jgi:sec-independent protein translocase protein TatA
MNTTLLFMGIGTQEFLFLALIILLLFGGKKIPELMKGLGKGVRSFKEGMNNMEKEIEDEPIKKE